MTTDADGVEWSEPQFVETADRVLGWQVSGPPTGRCRRTIKVWVERGPGLTRDEYERMSAAVVADLVAGGSDVFSWSAAE